MPKFCVAHYRELDKEWNGIQKVYGNEPVTIDDEHCEHLECIKRIRMACPYCLRELTPRQLVRIPQKPEL